jgi:hypothetical protein
LAHTCSERPKFALSLEKQPFTVARILAVKTARTPLLSGLAHLMRRRKDLRQLPEALGVGGELELVIYAPWASKSETPKTSFDQWLRPADHPPKLQN